MIEIKKIYVDFSLSVDFIQVDDQGNELKRESNFVISPPYNFIFTKDEIIELLSKSNI